VTASARLCVGSVSSQATKPGWARLCTLLSDAPHTGQDCGRILRHVSLLKHGGVERTQRGAGDHPDDRTGGVRRYERGLRPAHTLSNKPRYQHNIAATFKF